MKAKFVHGLYSNIVQHHEKCISESISPILSTCSSPSTLSASISSLPSYSPKITPSTSVSTYRLTNKKRLPNFGTASFTKGLELVSRTAFNWSQIVFVYPSLIRRSSDEQIIHDWADQKKFLNVDGGVPSVVTLSSRFGAGSVIHGSLTENEVVSVLAPASSLKLIIPSLNAIASKSYPVVLHISTGDSINPTTLQTKSIHDLSDIYIIFNTGFVIVASSTLQDIHDIGLVLSIMSRFGIWSIAHLYDGVKIGQEASSVNVFKYDELLGLIQSVKETGFIEELESGENTFVDIFNKVLSFLSPSLGNEYKPFEYFGSSSPDVVIINLLGVASTYFESVVSQLVQGKHKIGIVFIRLIRPWSMSHFIEAIPKTASKIIIIEHENTNQQYSQLYLDVVASFHHHHTPIDIIKSVHFQDETLAGLTYDGVKQFVTHLVKCGVTDDLVIHPTSSNIDPSLFQTNENTVSSIKFIEYDLKMNKEKTLVDELVHVLSAFDENIKVNVSHHIDSLNSSLSLTNLALGKGESSSDYADYIGIHDIKLLHHVAGKVGENACVHLNSHAKSVEELLDHGIVSKTLIYEWVTKKVTLFLVDVDAIVDEYTLFIPKHWKLHYRTFIFACLMLKITSSIYYNHRKLDGEVLIQKLRDLNIGIELENGVAIGRTLLGALDDAFLSPSHVTHEEALHIVDNLEGEDDDKAQTSSLPSSIEFNNTLVSTTPFITDAISKSAPFVLDQEEEKFYSITKTYKSMWSYIFPEAFKTKKSVSRPDIQDKHFVVTVQENRRLTPVDYDRNVFHIEMDISGTGLKYAVGEALGVYGHNDPEDVKRFLEFYGVDANEIYQVSSNGEEAEFRSIEQVLVQVLDLFGKPGKKFYQALLPFTTNHQERSRMAELIHSTVDFTEFVVKETPTYADVLHLFPSAHPPIEKLLQLIPAIKPRHYSIASSMNMHPTSVHLLVVLVEWKTHSGVYKKGQCTRYLSTMKVGDKLTVCVKPSVMKLPELHSQPVVMAGLGTGMAPFRAFIQERAYQKSKGIAIGSMMLYFGSRHRNLEYLYGEELELYHEAGILTHLGLAFSRDQAEKVYIQHKMKEDSKILGDVMMEEEGAFYLCGPTWPVPDVKEAWVSAFGEKGIKKEHASQVIEKLNGEERYILEVY